MRPIYLRKVEGVNRIDRVRSYDMAESLRQEDVLESVLRQKEWLRMMGDISEERLTNAVYVEEMQGKMPEQDCKMMGTGR